MKEFSFLSACLFTLALKSLLLPAWMAPVGLNPADLILLNFAPPVLAAELSEIKQRRYLIVAVKDNIRPLGFRGASGQLQGFEIDIARRLAQELLGNEDAIVLKPIENRDRIPAVLNGEVDLVIARMTVTPSRSRLVNFTSPYYLDGTGFVTAQPAVQRLLDITTASIAVLNGSTTVESLKYLLPDAKLVGVESYEAGRLALETGQAVAFAGDASVLTGWVQEYPHYRLLPSLISAEPLSIALPKGLQHDDLRRFVNNAIRRWEKEGWLQKRAAYWGLPSATLEVGTTESEIMP